MKSINLFTIVTKMLMKILLLAVLFSTSCNKFLDKKSDDALVTPQKIEELQSMLDNDAIMNNKVVQFSDVSADDYFLLPDTYNSLLDFERDAYVWNLFDYKWPNDWSNNYTPVYYSNVCLEQVEKVKKTSLNELQWNNVKGSALFYRSFYFLNLAWAFSKVYDESSAESSLGIVLRLTSDFNVPSFRSSVEETYNKIIQDIKDAVVLLPDNSQHQLRPSKAAAYGLLARAYLSMQKYDSSLKYSSLCLGIRNNLMDYNSDPDIVAITGTTPTFKKFNKETIFYAQISNTFTNIAFGLVDSNLYKSFQTNDLRKNAYFRPSNGHYSFRGSYSQSNSVQFCGISTNEIYLTRAESYARIGRISEAIDDLNTLLLKRWKTGTFINHTASTLQEALNLILTERRKELLFRNLRWIDIKRLNNEGANIALKRLIKSENFSLPPNDNRYALPLPSDIVNLGIQQN